MVIFVSNFEISANTLLTDDTLDSTQQVQEKHVESLKKQVQEKDDTISKLKQAVELHKNRQEMFDLSMKEQMTLKDEETKKIEELKDQNRKLSLANTSWKTKYEKLLSEIDDIKSRNTKDLCLWCNLWFNF